MKLIALSLLLAAGSAGAQVTSTVTLTSDYDFRGISQSATDPALQASLDWSNESGFYAGLWASNVDFDSESDVEVDGILGFSGGAEDGLGYDVGLVYYSYWPDDDDINYAEIYAGISYGVADAKVWYSNDYVNSGESAQYIEGNLNFELPADLTLTLHAGYSFGDFWDVLGDALSEELEENVDGEYMDYSIGLGYTLGHFDLSLKYVDNNADVEVTSDANNNEGRVILSFATTFPWSNE